MNITPTVAGFVVFAQNVMGVPGADMPTNDQMQQALDYASFWVPTDFQNYALPPTLSLNTNSPYVACVYNWAASLLIQFQPDAAGQNFFSTARTSYGIGTWVPGPISSVSNEATSQSMELGDGMKNLTFTDMQRAKDPYGRQALEFLQSIGTLWGLS
jgi:hypothetical protein